MLKAIIFDMDGVIIDSEPTNLRALSMAYQQLGADTSYEYCTRFVGNSLNDTLSVVNNEFQKTMTIEQIQSKFSENQSKIIKEEGYTPIEGTISLIKELAKVGYKLAIASSSSEKEIEAMADALNLHQYFHKLVSGRNVAHSKPEPDVFLLAASELGVRPEDCLIIEDSMNGTIAAARAGITCLGYQNPSSGNQDLSKAYCVVEDMATIDAAFVLEEYNHAHGLPVTIFETDRLILRELTVADVKALHSIYEKPTVTDYIPPLSTLSTEEDKMQAYLNYYAIAGYGLWGVFLKDTEKLIGRIGIEDFTYEGKNMIELGYLIAPDYQHNGYAMEILHDLLPLIHEKYDISTLYTRIHKENTPSIALATKCGFRYERTITVTNEIQDLYKLQLNVEK